ncbi:hypothetical protein GCM10027589_27690 [Actinocorallia lasiicapitis]
MNAEELAGLRRPRTYPAVSLIMPTHRTWPDRKQDRIRLKNLMDETAHRLRALDLPHGVADEVLDNLEKAAGQIDFEHTTDALVLLAAPDGEAHGFSFPHVNVEPRVVIDQTFATRDLVAMMETTPRYWVLVMSERPTRLWDGDAGHIEQVSNALFPMYYGESLPPDRGVSDLPIEKFQIEGDRQTHYHRNFFHEVEKNLTEVLHQDPRPLIVLGVQRYLAFFHELADGPVAKAFIGSVDGSYDSATAPELLELIDPVLAQAHADRQKQALADLGHARSAHKYVQGLEECWKMAFEARVEHLVVEENYIPQARILNDQLLPEHSTQSKYDRQMLPDGSTEGRVLDDAVDELCELAMNSDARITFVPDGSLSDAGRIAAVLRF